MKKHGFIQPHMLAEQDVVITTYDVLRSELNYVDIPHSNSKDGRRFRNQKRYMAIPSPLVAVEWWRICLDEAQMVECPTAKVTFRKSVVGINQRLDKHFGFCRMDSLNVVYPPFYVSGCRDGSPSGICQPLVCQRNSSPERVRR